MSDVSQDSFTSTPEFVQFSVITSMLQFGGVLSITKVISVHSDSQDRLSSVFTTIVYSPSGKSGLIHQVQSTSIKSISVHHDNI
jgi:hypothetical protein